MANYVIISSAKSITFEVDGKKAGFGTGDLIPAAPDEAGNIVRIRDRTATLTTIAFIENEALKIDLSVDSVDVNGVTVWPDAGALRDALELVFFFSVVGVGGWDAEVSTRNDLPVTTPLPPIGVVYLVTNPVTSFVIGIPYRTFQSGLYIRDTLNGNLNDWRRLNVKVQFTTSEFRLVDPADTGKQMDFDVSAATSGTINTHSLQGKDGVLAHLADISAPVDSVFTRTGDVVAENDDYRSDQLLVSTLDSSYYDFDFASYGTLRTGEYQFQTTGVNLSNPPFTVNASAIYQVRIKVNNDSWHSVEIDFSTQGDFLNQNRKFYRSGQTFVAALGIGWNERILQPQYEKLTSLEDFTNNPRPGQTTEGLINNTTAFETYLDQQFIPRRTGNFTISSFFMFSLNDGAQDFLANLQIFQGATLIGGLPRTFRKEPKDTAGGGEVLNLLSGGVIVGSANTSTNQRDARTPQIDVALVAGLTYNLRLTWACSAANDLAAIYAGQTSIKENL